MTSEYESAHDFEEEGETHERPRPRRRFRGSHWRHASQSQAPQQPAQHSPLQLRPLSINMVQSGFGDFMTNNRNNSTSAATMPSNRNLEISATSESYSYYLLHIGY